MHLAVNHSPSCFYTFLRRAADLACGVLFSFSQDDTPERVASVCKLPVEVILHDKHAVQAQVDLIGDGEVAGGLALAFLNGLRPLVLLRLLGRTVLRSVSDLVAIPTRALLDRDVRLGAPWSAVFAAAIGAPALGPGRVALGPRRATLGLWLATLELPLVPGVDGQHELIDMIEHVDVRHLLVVVVGRHDGGY